MHLMRIAEVVWLSIAGGAVPAYAEGDSARGRLAYRRCCIACHGDSKTASSAGPSLVGLIGRRAGTVAGAHYRRSLYESGIIWDEAALRRYLASPSDEVHGTIMPVGVHDPVERDDLVAYLKSLK
ncbi:MAG: c-type cytochrome [Betaproteobacteria bacterium]